MDSSSLTFFSIVLLTSTRLELGCLMTAIRGTFLPLPWKLWPYEGKILIILISIWSILGLFVLGSASWWVASKEMGDWAYYLKRQIIWYIPGLTFFYFVLNTNIRDLLKISKLIFYLFILLIISTIFFRGSRLAYGS